MKMKTNPIIILHIALISFFFLTPRNGVTMEMADSLFEYADVDQKPEIIFKASPYYPEAARKSGTEGTVVVEIVVNKKGKVISAEAVKSVPTLDEAAIKAASKCTFKPAKKDGKCVQVRMKIPYKFKLK